MRSRIWRRGGWVALGALLVGALVVATGPRSARGEPPVDDGVPSGTVVFVEGGSCPPGFIPASEAEGRLLVGVIDGPLVGVKVGTPLGDQEERAHQHSISGSITLRNDGYLTTDGPNSDGADPTTYPVTGVASERPTGLPFVQVQACEKL